MNSYFYFFSCADLPPICTEVSAKIRFFSCGSISRVRVAYVAYTKKTPKKELQTLTRRRGSTRPRCRSRPGQPSSAAPCPSPAEPAPARERRETRKRDRRNDDKKGDLVELDERRGITLIAPNETMTVER